MTFNHVSNNEFITRLTEIVEANITNPEFQEIFSEMETKVGEQKE